MSANRLTSSTWVPLFLFHFVFEQVSKNVVAEAVQSQTRVGVPLHCVGTSRGQDPTVDRCDAWVVCGPVRKIQSMRLRTSQDLDTSA